MNPPVDAVELWYGASLLGRVANVVAEDGVKGNEVSWRYGGLQTGADSDAHR